MSEEEKPRCPKCGSTDVEIKRVRWGKRMTECLNFWCDGDAKKREREKPDR
jgi:anaerobic ribonucleoside-triphosphate reductase